MSLFSLIRAMGVRKDIDVEELFDMEMLGIRNDVLFNIENDPSKGAEEDPEMYVAKRFSPGQPKEYQITRFNYLIDNYLLPHLGTMPSMRKRKIMYLAKMASRTTFVASGKMSADDRDHYGNKRVKLAGDLMGELFRYAFNYLIKDIVYQASRADVRGRKLQVHTIVRQDALTDRILYSMATGNWVAGQTGVSQLLDRISYLSSLSHRRRVISPLTKKHPHFKARDLHGTHYGKLCPSETPEGPSTSIVKNMAMFCEITTGYSDKETEEAVKKLGIEEE
jgi:DNA-directed RNA polymerase subunit B"